VPPTELQYISISDFRAGIRNRTMVGENSWSPQAPDIPGIATEEGTYRCIALPGGGLGPLPKRTWSLAPSNPGDVLNGDAWVSGMYIAGPIVNNTERRHELWLGVQYEKTATFERRYRLTRTRLFDAAATVDLVKDLTGAADNDSIQGTTFATTRSNRISPLDPGVPVVVIAWYEPGGGGEMFVSEFPDDDDPTVVGVFDISLSIAAEVITHQGRIVLLGLTDYDHGPTGGWSTNENLYWTVVNDPSTFSSAVASVFVPESPGGFATGASLSANELLLIKRSGGGGLTLNGDLDDPTVVNHPMIVNAGIENVGVNSPIGFIYGESSGLVWVWSGGDVVENLAPHMEDAFWQPANTDTGKAYIGTRMSWDCLGDQVWGPNGWLFDTSQGGWWRYDDLVDFTPRWVRRGDNRFIYVSPGFFDIGLAEAAVYSYDRATPADNYSWRSQPIPASVNRVLDVREIVLVASGAGTCTLTVTGLDTATQVETVELTGAQPRMYRIPTHMQAHNVQVQVVMDGETTSDPAPVLYELRIGHQQRMKVGA
jgi:hypothetical protein